MKKHTTLLFVSLALWVSGSLTFLYGQNVIWMESDFDAPRLVKTGIDSSELLSISLTAGSQPQGIALDAKANLLFWNTLAFVDAHINRDSTNFNRTAVLVDSQSVLRGLALDTLNNKMYWTSTNLISGPKIWRANRDGQSVEILIDFGAASNNTPRSIGLDVTAGKMYWTNFGAGTIQRADMLVGATPENILSGLNGPSGLAVDADSGKIFWTEMNGGQIKSANFDGSNTMLLVDGLSHPNYISINRTLNRMAWTELGTGKVMSAALDGSDLFDYGVKAVSPTGIVIEHTPDTTVITDIPFKEDGLLPKRFELKQNFPNPFNPTTIIRYQLATTGNVELAIYNLLGQKVTTLISKKQVAGIYSLEWDASGFVSGVYFYRLQTAPTAGSGTGFVQTKKLILLK